MCQILSPVPIKVLEKQIFVLQHKQKGLWGGITHA